ncbi:MbtH family NRPS accessory protein [Streptomyces sp. NPDC056632]|uniref:MbtH family NRPS accessory protein n=1 Tax=Streptomyces sp. NPDC056632 TaxID=3345884 RepID=UPI003678FF97
MIDIDRFNPQPPTGPARVNGSGACSVDGDERCPLLPRSAKENLMYTAVEQADASLLLLENGAGHYCLWPSEVRVPDGWNPALTTDGRRRFLESLTVEVAALSPVTFAKRNAQGRGET